MQLPRLYLAWLTPPHFAPGDAALDVVADVLAGGKNSRLYKRLVYDMQIAQDVQAYQASQAAVVVLRRQATPRPGHTRRRADEGHRRGDREAADATRRTCTRSSVRSTRSRRRSSTAWSGSAASAARPISSTPTTPTTGDPDYFNEDLARYRAMSPSDIRAAATQFLPRDRRVELTVAAGRSEVSDHENVPILCVSLIVCPASLAVVVARRRPIARSRRHPVRRRR